MLTSAVLVLWKSDSKLTSMKDEIREELSELRGREEELVDEIEEEDRREEDRVIRRKRRRDQSLVECPYCSEPIKYKARKCHHCGEYVDEDLADERAPKRYNTGVAAVLSFFIPGLGQLYKGQVLGGLVWWLIVGIGYVCCVLPGIGLHIICLFDAASE
jgi:hypothetical protein